jgi:hypothetical protein
MVSLIVTATTVLALRGPTEISSTVGGERIPTVLIGFVSDNLRHVNPSRLFQFPNPVNETSARIVAAGVVMMALAFLVLREGWILIPLTYGFLARVATGPTLSPLGQFATRFATPRVEAVRGAGFHSRQVPGPPKRFAQAIGLGFTALASIAWLLDAPAVSWGLIAMLAAAATLEAAFAICLGCIAYSAIWGCADCNDISARLRQALVEARQEVDGASDGSPAAVTAAEAGAPAMR